jgi:hypothetical protein
VTKKFVTITFSDKLNVTKPCSSRNSLGDEMKGLGDESHSSPKTIFLVDLFDLQSNFGRREFVFGFWPLICGIRFSTIRSVQIDLLDMLPLVSRLKCVTFGIFPDSI